MSEEQAQTASSWELRHDDTSGQAFYVNVLTGEASWEAPAELKAPLLDATIPSARQWKEVVDDSGSVYYMNMKTMETSWDPPPGYSNAASENLTLRPSRPSRPSTAEQMEQLNALLSGGDGDDDEEVQEVHNDHVATEALAATGTGGDGSEWMMFLNETDGIPYYYNHITGECVWEPPAAFLEYHAQLADVEPTGGAIEGETVVVSDNGSEAHQPTREALVLPPQTPSAPIEITPEFEDKVRQAVETVSKTPVGSSRLLFVRTPTVKSIDSSRPASRPTSSSGASARQRIATARAVAETEASPESATPDIERQDLQDSLEPSAEKTVETAEAVELPPSDDDIELLQREAMMQDLERDEMALTIQCMVRCSQARARVARKKKERQVLVVFDEATAAEIIDSTGQENANHSAAATSQEPLPAIGTEDTLATPTATTESRELGEQMSPEFGEQVSLEFAEQVSPEFGERVAVENEVVVTAPTSSMENTLDAIEQVEEGVERSDQDTSAPREVSPDVLGIEGVIEPTRDPLVTGEKNEVVNNVGEDAPPTTAVDFVVSNTIVESRAERAIPAHNEECHSPESTLPDEQTTQVTEETPVVDDQVRHLAESGSDEPTTIPSEVSTERTPDTSLSSQNILAAPIPVVEQRRPDHDEAAETVSAVVLETPRGNVVEVALKSREVKSTEHELRIEPASTQPNTRRERSSRRSEERPSVRTARPMPPNAVATSTESIAVLDVSTFFPPDRRRGHTESSTVPSVVTTGSVTTGGIARKAVSTSKGISTFAAKTVEERATERAMRAKIRQSERENVNAKWNQEVEQYCQVFATSAARFAREAQDIDAAEQDRVDRAQEEQKHWLRDQVARAQPDEKKSKTSFSLWDVNCDDNAPGDVTTHLRAALEPQGFVAAMMRERLVVINRVIGRCETPNNRANGATYWQQLTQGFPAETGKDAKIDHPYWARLHTKLHAMATDGHRVARELACYRTDSFDSLLHAAAWQGHATLVSFLVSDIHADVNAVDCTATQSTPLHEACRGGHGAVVDTLLSHGAALDATDSLGDTPLHIACRLGWTRIVQKLIAVGHGQDVTSDGGDPKLATDRVKNLRVCSWVECFTLRNGKHRRALDLATLPTLVEFLTQYSSDLQGQANDTSISASSTDIAAGQTKTRKKKVKQTRPKSAAKLDLVSAR